jgi:HEAT repeat protein
MKNLIKILLFLSFIPALFAETTAELANQIVVEGSSDDSKVKIALRKMSHEVMTKSDGERVKHVQAILQVIDAKKAVEVKAFLIRELQYIGGEEVVAAVSRYLLHKDLCEPAVQTLTAVFQKAEAKSIQKAISLAFLKATGANELTLAKACGAVRCNESKVLSKLKKLALNNDWSISHPALQSIAAIGVQGSEAIFVKAVKTNKNSSRSFSLKLSFLYARRLGETNKAAAAAFCQSFLPQLQDQKDAPYLVDCLQSLIEIQGASVIDGLLKYLEHPNPRISKSFAYILQEMDDKAIDAKLLTLLKKGSPKVKIIVMSLLLENSPTEVTPFIVEFLKSSNSELKNTALKACTKLDAAVATPFLLKALLSGNEADRQLAKSTMTQLALDKKTIAMICSSYEQQSNIQNKILLINLLAECSAKGAMKPIAHAAKSTDAALRQEALKALKTTSSVQDTKQLMVLLAKAQKSSELRSIQNGLFAAFRGKEQVPEVDLLVLSSKRAKGNQQAVILNTLASLDSKKTIDALQSFALSRDASIQRAAVKALSGSPSLLAAPALALACGQGSSSNRILAARGLLQVVNGVEGDDLIKKRALEKALPLVRSALEKGQLKKALASLGRSAK